VASTDILTVAGTFDDASKARYAVDELLRAGFTHEQIGWIQKDGGAAPAPVPPHTAPEQGAAVGAVTGGSLGGLLGAVLALTLPGAGPILAAGVLAGLLGGATIGITGGGLVGALIGLGLSNEEADYFHREVQSGRTLVTVKAGPRHAEAAALLARCGAYGRTPTTASV